VSEPDLPEFTAYPPAPWRSRGLMWIGLLRTTDPLTTPLPLLSGARNLAVLLIRYQQGALNYDEFVLASLVRQSRRPGLWVHRIWVDSAASLWGGRQVWGVPKQMATFTWTECGVEVGDNAGPLASLSLTSHVSRGLPMALRFGGFGHHDGTLLLSTAVVRGRIKPVRIKVTGWSDRLPRLAGTTGRFGVSLNPMHIVVHEPRRFGPVVHDQG
jgi:hypothetical protein